MIAFSKSCRSRQKCVFYFFLIIFCSFEWKTLHYSLYRTFLQIIYLVQGKKIQYLPAVETKLADDVIYFLHDKITILVRENVLVVAAFSRERKRGTLRARTDRGRRV